MNRKEERLLKEFGYKQELKRTLGVWDLTAFGLNYMIPIAPAIIFGSILKTSGGTVALPYLLALLGVLFTAFSYAYFIKIYPLAGSLYSFVSKALGPGAGFIAGWSILLDYVLIPALTAMSATYFLINLIPGISYKLTLTMFICITGLLNLIGSQFLARLGLSLLILGEVVIFIGFFSWAYSVIMHHVGVGHLISAEPFHFSSFSALTSATSIAMLSYLGFDAITTLAEEAKAPCKDIPRAIFFSLFIGSITMFLTGYFAMLVIPDWQIYVQNQNWVNTTLFFVSKATGGEPLVLLYSVGFIIAMAVFNVVATQGASRLLFGMSRDRAIPIPYLHQVGKRSYVPMYSILLIVFIQLVIGSLFTLTAITEIVNFGALFGFTILNIAALIHISGSKFYIKKTSVLSFLPIIGASLNFWLLIHLDTMALAGGMIWVLIGIALYIIINKLAA